MYPQRIICLTEESVETLFLLGQGHKIVGVSSYAVRPKEVEKIPKVSLFTSSQFEKIDELKPDLILGFSDIQKDIASELIGRGHNVFISNQRSIEEIFTYIKTLSGMVGCQVEGEALIRDLKFEFEKYRNSITTSPKVYFEEWDEPMISGIQWVSELIEWCGGSDIFGNRSNGKLAKERFVTSNEVIERNPQIIFGCWCGKKVKIEKIKNREGWSDISAIKDEKIFELDPAVFLQPGPALMIDGAKQMSDFLKRRQVKCLVSL